ncbi:MAG: TIR domain-containing protein [Nitrospira sp.]|nr:TIR domain-containing protein [Nitrospira sp.]
MPNGFGYEYDVFVSYAHADNEKPLGSVAEHGWVTTLAHNLNTGPGHYHKNLFIDHQLKPGDPFSDDLFKKVEHSTLLLLLLSQNYIDSPWCGDELEHFIRTHSNDSNKLADVFVVELLPFETFSNVPANIQNLRKRLIHAQFWHQLADSSAPILGGDPSPQECSPESGRHYWLKLRELRNAIDSRLRSLHPNKPSVSVAAQVDDSHSASLPRNTKESLGTILLADTTEDLVAQRDAVKARLEPEGIVVLPEGDYVGLTAEEFKTELASDLAKSQLFVQLLSTTVGRTGKGFAAPLPQLQFDQAVSAKLPIMQWCERLPGSVEIPDSQHARLFETAFLRAINRTAFEQEVIARLQAMQRAAKAKQVEDAASPAQAATKKLIFVDDVAGQKDLNDKLRVWLRSANCDVRGLPPKAALDSNGIDLVQVLKPCRAGITVFADSAKLETVYNRLIFFLNQIAESRLPVSRWGVYVTPDTVGCDLGLISDDVLTITEEQLSEFVNGLEQ